MNTSRHGPSGILSVTDAPVDFAEEVWVHSRAADCKRMVYAFADGTSAAGGTIPDDYDGKSPDPVQIAKADATSGEDDTLTIAARKGAVVQANLVTSGVNLP